MIKIDKILSILIDGGELSPIIFYNKKEERLATVSFVQSKMIFVGDLVNDTQELIDMYKKEYTEIEDLEITKVIFHDEDITEAKFNS